MSQYLFFPDPTFAWTAYVVLVGLLGLAAYFDLRGLIIPKPISLLALALGIIVNVIRGYWLGSLGLPVWELEVTAGWMGAVNGLLFSLAGFGTGFGIFFLMWILKTCGGGDVKLFAALGAWVGPGWAIWLLVGTIVFVALLAGLRFGYSVLTSGFGKAFKNYSAKEGPANRRKGKDAGETQPPTTRRRLMAYSLPMALSTALLLLWLWDRDLQLGLHAPKSTHVPAGAR